MQLAYCWRLCLLFLMLSLSALSSAADIIKISIGQSEKDVRNQYTNEILTQALKLSAERYGPYTMQAMQYAVPNNRKLSLLQTGEILNIAMALTTLEWEEKTIPIRIPLRLGILNYRLLATHKNKLPLFSDISTAEDLKKLTVGLRKSWATWTVMHQLGFKIEDAFSYDGIFGMLDKQRFDYIPRGSHEIVDELTLRQKQYPELTIEPKLALYIPAPLYMFISHKTPHIAERLEYGLEEMVKQGLLRKIFYRYYAKHLEKADLANRTIINIGNPVLPPKTPLHRKELWLDFNNLQLPPQK
ncbi:substrate-binding periplasmic protein [Algibacillus agarilyticus]|uniref:substrate-binding periplasmic protein n=1 Tax=Algibacillus agarilyticus TaxID=2234133 RepID=UPI000DCFB12A|nr:hypothetical protein [Algibacillus agarilyticus]